MLIGRAPHIAENAWLNRLYSPIDKIEILKLEDGINKKIPASYVDFLTDFSNGLNILGDTLCLFGYRSNYMRTVDFSWQPYSLVSLNSLSSMLISELKRLYNIFDSSGIQIDDTQATTPI